MTYALNLYKTRSYTLCAHWLLKSIPGRPGKTITYGTTIRKSFGKDLNLPIVSHLVVLNSIKNWVHFLCFLYFDVPPEVEI